MVRTTWRRLAVLLLAAAMGVVGLVATEQPASAATRHPIKVSIANIGSVRDPHLGPMLQRARPQVMVVTEAYFARAHLRTLARRYGYRLRQYRRARAGAEAPDVAVLVRDGVRIQSVSLMKMARTWHYNGHLRRPRRYPVLVVRYSGKTWTVIGAHFPPGGPMGRNAVAWAESRRRIRVYAANHKSTPVVVAGDFNADASTLAAKFPGFIVRKGGKVDHAMIKKGRGARFDGVIRHTIRNRNSHGWLTFRLSAA